MRNFSRTLSRFSWALTAVVLVACAGSRPAKEAETPPAALSELQAQLNAILSDPGLLQTRSGIKVVSLDTGEVLYAKNSELLFHPASNMKLLTTATALSELGPTFNFKTAVLAEPGTVNDSSLTGPLYLKGYGDPDLTSNDLRDMAQDMSDLGIRKITGDIICDDTYLDDLRFGAGWMWDDASSKYFPPIGALTVNRNCVRVKVRPGSQPGDSLTVILQPATHFVKIENRGVTVSAVDSSKIDSFKVERNWQELENTVVVQGGLPVASGLREFELEIVEPSLYFGTLFADALLEKGVDFSGEVRRGVAPDAALTLFEHQSAPLAEILRRTAKVGYNNLYAELILKTVGAEIVGTPGTAQKGLSVVNRFLHHTGIDTTTFELADGSGVSRYNLLSPDHIIQLLRRMYADFSVRPEFIAALPIAGVDGTLENRMRGTAAEGKLRAKTGTLRGVSALSGYTMTADGEPLVFSIMMEHFVTPLSRIREIQDHIGVVLSAFSRSQR